MFVRGYKYQYIYILGYIFNFNLYVVSFDVYCYYGQSSTKLSATKTHDTGRAFGCYDS